MSSWRAAATIPTLETLAAVDLLRQYAPELKVRVVNVVDLMKIQPAEEHPHGLPAKPVRRNLHHGQTSIIFAFHGYPLADSPSHASSDQP